MRVEQVRTAQLARMAAPWNPRRISDHDLAALGRSMTEFGVVEPIVVNTRTGRVVGGHQRIRAAEVRGIETLPVVHVDLDETQERQLNIALNRISGEFAMEELAALLNELRVADADLSLTGFTAGELAEILGTLDQPADGLTDPDLVPEPPDEPATRRGDLIVLGDHRLLCGDAGSAEDVARLLDGQVVQLVNTDPPYNVNVEPRSNNAIAANLAAGGRGSKKGNVPRAQLERARGRRGVTHHQGLDLARHPGKSKPTGKLRAKDRPLAGDFVSDEQYGRLLRAWFGNLAAALEPGRGYYLWGGYSNIRNYPAAIEEAGLYFSQAIIWDKQWPVLTRKDFMGAHEWCFYGWREGAAHYFAPGIHNATDLWRVKKVNPTAMQHLTEKPVELAELAMGYSSRKGERVLDLFGGSGSTLIAAERMGRRAYLMEIDCAYCDVITTRWQQFTGKRAEGWRG